MKTLFVVLPFIVENYTEIAEKVAFAIESMLGVHLQLKPVIQPFYSVGAYFEFDREHTSKGKEKVITPKQEANLLKNYLDYMLAADYIAFTSDWHEHTESIILHGIASAYGMEIVEVPIKVQPEAPKNELQACPFCGGKAEYYVTENGTQVMYSLQCNKCFVSTPLVKNKEEARSIWNSRTAECESKAAEENK